jgi:hypothetical protein
VSSLDPRQRWVALRGLLLGLTLSWLVKLQLFATAYWVYRALPLRDPFFPAPLQALPTAVCALCLPIAASLLTFLLRSPASTRLTLVAYALGSAVLLVHQGTFNDATFLSTLWVASIGIWFERASRVPDPALATRLAYLTQLLVGLLFLGGFVGKLTPGYLDGSTLYDIYFVDRDHFTFSLLRRLARGASLEGLARAYSWFVLGSELALATLPLWPSKPALRFTVLASVGLVLLNNFLLASVLLSVAALALVSLYVLRESLRSAAARA